MALTPRRACAILSAVEAAVSRWRQIGKNIGMTAAELNAFETAFEHEERFMLVNIARKTRLVTYNPYHTSSG